MASLACLVSVACRSSSPGASGEAGEAEEELPAAAVRCEGIAARQVEEVVEVSGVIAPRPMLDAILSSPVAGRIGRLFVEEGDAVAAGARLAIVEDPALPAGSLEALANVAAAQAASEAAGLELARQEQLVAAGISARKELEDARAAAATAAAGLDAARVRAGLAAHQLARRELRAPHAGVVLHVWKRVGESVDGTAATPVLEVADLSVLEVRAQVTPAVLGKLADGLAAQVQALGAAAALPAIVARVAPAVDPVTSLGTVRVQLRRAARLPVGSAATARISLGQHLGRVVPAAALRRSPLGTDEVVVCAGGVARGRAVTLGARTEAGVEVTGGLADGEAIVVDHVLGLEDGQRLALTPAPGAAPGTPAPGGTSP